jgi:hypothetical protein
MIHLIYILVALALGGAGVKLGMTLGKAIGRSSLKNDLNKLTVRQTLNFKRNKYLNI